MKKFIDFIFNEILWCMPHELAHKMLYRYRMGEKLNLKDPTNINEKIQWLILIDHNNCLLFFIEIITINFLEFISLLNCAANVKIYHMLSKSFTINKHNLGFIFWGVV